MGHWDGWMGAVLQLCPIHGPDLKQCIGEIYIQEHIGDIFPIY